jgi:hypothetical protein
MEKDNADATAVGKAMLEISLVGAADPRGTRKRAQQ